MYINPEVWKQLRNRQGHRILEEAQEISAVVEALNIGLAMGTIYGLAYDKAKRDLEHRNRVEKFKARRKYRAI